MNKQKKLVIKVNYDSSEKLPADGKLKLGMTEGWNAKRIVIILLVVLFLIAAGLYYVFYKTGIPGIDTPDPDSITNVQPIENKPEVTGSLETYQEEIAEQLLENENEIEEEEGNTKIVDVIEEKDKDNIVAVKAPYSNQVARSQLTSRVINHEPIDLISSPILVEKDNIRRLYYFTELIDMSGKTIYHSWSYKGDSIFRREFDIKGDRWRVTTLKKLDTTLLGDWKVTLTDSKGNLLHEISFEVIK